MLRTARSTCPRCLGSPISKVNRLNATRSRLVVTAADKILTCWSDSTLVTSAKSLVRSSASTWMATRNTEPSLGAQCTLTSRSRWVSVRCWMFTQSARCTDTPCPCVTNPGIGSPGTGVQHRDSRTQTSAAPSTSTPESPGVLGRGAPAGARPAGDVHLPAADPARRPDQLVDDRLGTDLALADRGIQPGQIR